MFRFPDETRHSEYFFLFPRWYIQTGEWAKLTLAAKASYSVIGCHTNRNGVAWPTNETVAGYAGYRDTDAITDGVNMLRKTALIPKIEQQITPRGHRTRKYHLKLPQPNERGRSFPFYRALIDGGNWAMLTHTAQALYPVIRTYSAYKSEFEFDHYEYETREYEMCNAETDVLYEQAGISRKSLQGAIESLEYCELLEITAEGYLIYLKPKHFFKPEFLNKKYGKKPELSIS